MTSALGKNDMKAIGLHMALDLIHQKRQRDMITGLMTKTEAGRPDWNQVLKLINAPWLAADIRVLWLSYRLCKLKIISTCTLAFSLVKEDYGI